MMADSMEESMPNFVLRPGLMGHKNENMTSLAERGLSHLLGAV
jgi:hypothetical protein